MLGFIEFIRGVPSHHVAVRGFDAAELLPAAWHNLSILILRVIIMVTLFAAAYMAEVDPRWPGGFAPRVNTRRPTRWA